MKFDRIQIEATNYCNMKCSFCPYPCLKKKRGDLDYGLYKRVIKDIARHNLTENISFAGMGEPLLKKDLSKYIKFANDKSLKTIVTTNGLLLDKDRLSNLSTNGLDEIWYSYQTFTPEAFKTRGIAKNFSFDQYTKNLLRIVEYVIKERINIRLYISFMFNRWERYKRKKLFPKELHSLLRQSKKKLELENTIMLELKILAIKYSIWDNIDEFLRVFYDKSRFRRLSQFEILPNIYVNIDEIFGWAIEEKSNYYKKPTTTGNCKIMKAGPIILANGDVSICCWDARGVLVVGNIAQANLSEILSSEKYRKIYDSFAKGVIVEEYCKFCKGKWVHKNLFIRLLDKIISHSRILDEIASRWSE